MNIRSVTIGINWEEYSKDNIENDLRCFLECAREVFTSGNHPVRTFRLTLDPINLHGNLEAAGINAIARWISDFCDTHGIRWFCMPFLPSPHENEDMYRIALEIIRRYQRAFVNIMATHRDIINTRAILKAGAFIKSVSRLSNNGYDNFRVGVSCNCKPATPFFPFTHHAGENGFSIALELPRYFAEVIGAHGNGSLGAVRKKIIAELAPRLSEVESCARRIEEKTPMTYHGIDASLAPFPKEENSVARLIELLGVHSFGGNGTLFFTSFLTDIIRELVKTSGITPAGFNGVMYSVLEDAHIGHTNQSRLFSMDSLVSFSSVCGCGIDMVPVPGDTLEEEIASLILDIAGMSVTLDKPLGIRVLPIPMKYENEFTDFHYDFLYNTRIKAIRNRTCPPETFREGAFTYLSRGNGKRNG